MVYVYILGLLIRYNISYARYRYQRLASSMQGRSSPYFARDDMINYSYSQASIAMLLDVNVNPEIVFIFERLRIEY